MSFLLTSYLYPIETPIELSSSLGITLDNPSDKELDEIQEYLTTCHQGIPSQTFPPDGETDTVSLRWVLDKFFENYSSHDQYVGRFAGESRDENIYRVLAKMWVIARYDDMGRRQELKNERDRLRQDGEKNFFFLLDDDDPAISTKSNATSYFSLLSLLANSEGNSYYGRQILLDNENSEYERHVPRAEVFGRCFQMFTIFAISAEWNKPDPLSWANFPLAVELLTSAAGLLEKALNEERREPTLYIGSILNLVGAKARDDRISILSLVGIVEFLITHNPDFNRFNVENSITRQFVLKTIVLLHLADEDCDLEAHKKQLKTIYKLRSCIAHGDLAAAHRLVDNSGKNEYMSSFVADLYWHVRVAIKCWLSNPVFIKLLKEG